METGIHNIKPEDRVIVGYVLTRKALQNLADDALAKDHALEYIRTNLLYLEDGATIQEQEGNNGGEQSEAGLSGTHQKEIQ